jgi:hypothetical protein
MVQVPAVVPAVNRPVKLTVEPVHPVPLGRVHVASDVTSVDGPLLKMDLAVN